MICVFDVSVYVTAGERFLQNPHSSVTRPKNIKTQICRTVFQELNVSLVAAEVVVRAVQLLLVAVIYSFWPTTLAAPKLALIRGGGALGQEERRDSTVRRSSRTAGNSSV